MRTSLEPGRFAHAGQHGVLCHLHPGSGRKPAAPWLQPLRATRMAAVQASVMLAASSGAVAGCVVGSCRLGRLPSLEFQPGMALVYLGVLASVVVVTLQAWGSSAWTPCAAPSSLVWNRCLPPSRPGLCWANAWVGPGWVAAAMIVTALVLSQSPAGPKSSSVHAQWSAGDVGHLGGLARGADAGRLRTAAMSFHWGIRPGNQ